MVIKVKFDLIKEHYMNGKEYMYENFTKRKFADILPSFNCPRDFEFETELSANKEYCNSSCQGDCEACWSSKVI
jgi:hypothetical protein